MPSDRAFPDYAFVPGGTWPHPNHGEGEDSQEPPPPPISDAEWRTSEAYRQGFSLFDAGYYWEAHEVWESLWHAAGRTGPEADTLKALIKLAAAGVKVRQGQPYGVTTHANRAAALFGAVRREVGPTWLGLDLDACESLAQTIAAAPPTDPMPPGERVSKVFAFTLSPFET